jgi:hypothetical protein
MRQKPIWLRTDNILFLLVLLGSLSLAVIMITRAVW